jgi:hypothetical protein
MYRIRLEDVKNTKNRILEGINKSKEQLGRIKSDALPNIYSDISEVAREVSHFTLCGFKDDIVYPFNSLNTEYSWLAEHETNLSKRVDYVVKAEIAEGLFEEGVGLKNKLTAPLPKGVTDAGVIHINKVEKAATRMKIGVIETELYLEKAQFFLENICKDK